MKSDVVFYPAGIVFMGLAWAKQHLNGYRTPTSFDASDIETGARHAADIASDWTTYIDRYRGARWEGDDVLELGPGSTVATGVQLLLRGAASYEAVDKFSLAKGESARRTYSLALDGSPRRDELLALTDRLDAAPLRYTVEPDFDIEKAVGGRTFSRIVSNAAFEHFDDVGRTVDQLTSVARPGAIACLRIDFATHSRWLRQRDPNNIYRYPDWLYWSLPFPGKPNRLRPDEYIGHMERNGWRNIDFYPVKTVQAHQTYATGAGKFHRPGARMEVLSGVVVATKPGD